MSLTLYYNDVNSESRAVLLVCRALNIDLELKEVDAYAGEICDEISEASIVGINYLMYTR